MLLVTLESKGVKDEKGGAVLGESTHLQETEGKTKQKGWSGAGPEKGVGPQAAPLAEGVGGSLGFISQLL